MSDRVSLYCEAGSSYTCVEALEAARRYPDEVDFFPDIKGIESVIAEDNADGSSDLFLLVPGLQNRKFLLASTQPGLVFRSPYFQTAPLLRGANKHDIVCDIYFKYGNEPADTNKIDTKYLPYSYILKMVQSAPVEIEQG